LKGEVEDGATELLSTSAGLGEARDSGAIPRLRLLEGLRDGGRERPTGKKEGGQGKRRKEGRRRRRPGAGSRRSFSASKTSRRWRWRGTWELHAAAPCNSTMKTRRFCKLPLALQVFLGK
jgi:hypothetical protein